MEWILDPGMMNVQYIKKSALDIDPLWFIFICVLHDNSRSVTNNLRYCFHMNTNGPLSCMQNQPNVSSNAFNYIKSCAMQLTLISTRGCYSWLRPAVTRKKISGSEWIVSTCFSGHYSFNTEHFSTNVLRWS